MHLGNFAYSTLVIFITCSPRAISFAATEAPPILVAAKELLGTPFDADPVTRPGLRHPTEAKQATNCAGVVIYGLRHSGTTMPYLGAKGLRLRMQSLGWQVRDGRIQSGDILHFGSQTALVAEDRPPYGELNDDDLILHAYYAPVQIQRWRDIPYHLGRYEVYRDPRLTSAARDTR